jgi:aminoglycoside/choline kinase family phosphotransferase
MDFAVTHLSGDGSDRAFYRLQTENRSMILSDHGITLTSDKTEASSFVRIGIHLRSKNLPVPRILGSDLISGHVYLEDLGDTHLEAVARQSSPSVVYDLYRKVTHALAHLSFEGFKGFRPEFTYQTEVYDVPMIVEKECLYFLNAFVKDVLGREIPPDILMDEFSHLALKAVENGYVGFMHRDFQSRNIMIKNDTCYFIDFQGGRTGPVQYDLASLLIDPYVDLAPELQDTLLDDFMDYYGTLIPLDRDKFLAGYNYLRITRNLQMLGAFGFLSRVKGKSRFADYIPTAVKNLKRKDRKSTRLNSSHNSESRMPSSA